MKNSEPCKLLVLEIFSGKTQLTHPEIAHRARCVAKKAQQCPGPGNRQADFASVESSRDHLRCAITGCQGSHSVSSRKISSTCFPKSLPILNARPRLGSYLPFSMTLIVCRLTPRRVASSAWLSSLSARSTRSLFFTGGCPDSPVTAIGNP